MKSIRISYIIRYVLLYNYFILKLFITFLTMQKIL